MTEKQKKIVSGIVIAAFIIFCIGVGWFVAWPLVKFAGDYDKFKDWVQSMGFYGKLAYIGITAFQVVIALVPGEPVEFVAGYAFGPVWGTVLCIIGITLGSVIVFFLVRKFGVKLLEVFFKEEKIKSLKFLQNEKRMALITFFLFFLPGTPKDLLTYFVGLTRINFKVFLFIASIARIPSILSSTIAGGFAGDDKYLYAGIAYVATLLLSGVGLIVYNRIRKNNLKEER